jgi:hypothetical protein
LIGGASATTAGVVKGLIALIKRLRGRANQKIVLLDNGLARVVLDDESFETERQVIELFRRLRLRKGLEDLLRPLERDGIDEFAVVSSAMERLEIIRKSERHYFAAPGVEQETLSEEEVELNLQLLNVAFQDDNKWRFTDGTSSFYAAIADTNFLNAVKKGQESFTSGDVLKARLLRRQFLVGEQMRTEYQLLEVLDHRRSGAQLNLPISNE